MVDHGQDRDPQRHHADDRGDQAVDPLRPGLELERRDHLAVAEGPVRAAEPGAGRPDDDPHDDEGEGHRQRRRDELLEAGHRTSGSVIVRGRRPASGTRRPPARTCSGRAGRIVPCRPLDQGRRSQARAGALRDFPLASAGASPPADMVSPAALAPCHPAHGNARRRLRASPGLAATLAATIVLAACTSAGEPAGTAGATPTADLPGATAGPAAACDAGAFPGWPTPGQVTTSGIIPVLASSEKLVGESRLLFALVDDQNRPIADDTLEVEIGFFDLCADPATPTEIVTPGFAWGIVGQRAFYVTTPTLTQPGPWGAAVAVRDPATGVTTGAKLQFTVSEGGFGPRVGDAAPAVEDAHARRRRWRRPQDLHGPDARAGLLRDLARRRPRRARSRSCSPSSRRPSARAPSAAPRSTSSSRP